MKKMVKATVIATALTLGITTFMGIENSNTAYASDYVVPDGSDLAAALATINSKVVSTPKAKSVTKTTPKVKSVTKTTSKAKSKAISKIKKAATKAKGKKITVKTKKLAKTTTVYGSASKKYSITVDNYETGKAVEASRTKFGGYLIED